MKITKFDEKNEKHLKECISHLNLKYDRKVRIQKKFEKYLKKVKHGEK